MPNRHLTPAGDHGALAGRPRLRLACVAVAVALQAALPLAAQLPLAPSDPVARLQERWRWVRFGPQSGLPTGRLLEVLESAGTSWVVTDLGFAWFDGYRWTRVAGRDSGVLVSPRRLTPDGSGGAYGVAGGRLVHVTREHLRVVPLPPSVPQQVRSVARLRTGALLLLADTMLIRLEGERAEPLVPPPAARPTLAQRGGRLLRTRLNHVWLLAGGIWRWDDGTWTRWFDHDSPAFRETEAGGLFVATVSGAAPEVFEWRGEERPSRAPVTGTAISALSLAPNGDAVVVFWEGRAVIRHEGAWSPLSPLPEPLEWARQVVHRDNGDFWAIGPRGLFLFRRNARRWDRWRLEGRDEFTGFVNAILRTRDGELWLGTGQGLVIRDRSGRQREVGAIDGVPLGAVTGLAEDSAGGIWVGSGAGFAGAFRWNGRVWRRYGPAQGLAAPRVHRIVPDRRGGLWFLGLDSAAIGGPGAFRWDGTRFTRWGQAEGLPGGRVYAVAEARDGTLWFGTDQGLSRWRDGAWRHWPVGANGVGARVYAVAVDSAGTAWFGHRFAGIGLGRITPDGEVQRVAIGEGPWLEVADLQTGPDGAIWFTTHAGLGRVRDGVVSLFGATSGLDNPRLWPILPGEDGVLAGGDGVFRLDLAEEALPPPAVYLERPLWYPPEVLLRWVVLAHWGVTPSEELETRYRLDGGAWSAWTLTRQMSLFGLRPGRHRLEVQGKGLFGRLSPVPASVTFDIPLPWYRRGPFLAAAASLTIAALAAGLYVGRRRREHRLALEQLNRTLAADVAERRRTEAALEESRRFIQRIADSVPSILFLLRADDGMVLYVNREVERILGLAPEALIQRASYLDLVGQTGRAGAAAHLGRLGEAHDGDIVEGETAIEARCGTVRTLALRSAVFARDGDGRVESVLSVAQDVTAQRALEAQLAQAQKMETVGRLAGGVAHDFNNLLTAITGYADFAREAVPPESPARADLDEISRAADRARNLTGQLLAFARRQVVKPRVIDLNRLVTDIDRMLRRLIGEHIELVTRLSPDLWPVSVDPSQLEQVLLNLAVNARDAMPRGGRLVIATRNVADGWGGTGPGGERLEGPCVLLAVEDDGEGMDPDVAARIFEPFFTTKEPGQGTGLGLATCYGIIRQAGGVIHADSTPGAGSTFYVALPRAPADAPDGRRAAEPGVSPRGSETILLVEDEAQVRSLASRVLRAAGYRVHEAGHGREALALLARIAEPPDLLLSDVVMPEMGGAELWSALRRRYPALRVLFVSGYTGSAVMDQGVADQSLPFLGKPFTGAQLTARVRQVLDQPAPPAARRPPAPAAGPQ